MEVENEDSLGMMNDLSMDFKWVQVPMETKVWILSGVLCIICLSKRKLKLNDETEAFDFDECLIE